MIHSCYVCDQPATRRCNYEKCHYIPFICGGKCKNNENAAELMHTHNGKTSFSPYEDTINAATLVKQLQNTLVNGLREKKAEAEIHYDQAFHSLRSGKYENVLSELTSAHNIYPYDKKYSNKIKQLLQASKNQQIKQAKEHYNKAHAFYQNQQFEYAIIEVSQAIDLVKNNFNYYLLRANICLDIGLFQFAIKDFNQVQKINPQVDYFFYFRKALAELGIRDLQQSIISFTKSIQLNLSSGVSLNERGSLYMQLNFYDLALQDFTKAIELDITNPWYYYNRGIVFNRINRFQEALKDYDKAIQLYGKFGDYYCNRGLVYYNLQQYERSIEDYNTAIGLNDKHVLYWQNRGNSYHSLYNFQQAIEDYGKAIEIQPNNARLFWNRGNSYFSSRNMFEALKDYTKAIQIQESDQHYKSRAEAYFKMNDYKNALLDFTKAIQLNPKDYRLFYRRSILFQKLKKYQKSINDCSQAIKMKPSAFLYIQRSDIYLIMKKYDKALADLDEVVFYNPTPQRNYKLKAKIHRLMGNHIQAREDLKKAAEIQQMKKK